MIHKDSRKKSVNQDVCKQLDKWRAQGNLQNVSRLVPLVQLLDSAEFVI